MDAFPQDGIDSIGMTGRAEGSIDDRVRKVLDRIGRAAQASGRARESVRLVAATKTVCVERIREAIAGGLRLAGENRLQEALPKIEALRGEPIRWHFIGRLQRRKVRDVVGRFDVIHSVESLELASEINRRAEAAGFRQQVLLEVNVGEETTKAGFIPDRLEEMLPQFSELAYLDIQGLMTIPPPVDDAEQARPYFRRLHDLAHSLSHQAGSAIMMKELSMGMSNDYFVAIEEGATIVRVGTALFGTRDA